ncbi:MAG: isoprenylcysteine carboxylmethyltransferase family protein [Phenylobacterium sp.]|nr:MAG: isoprenylcysteine carboxylmethyltransferase family protein [Phenylobacterium sp.]
MLWGVKSHATTLLGSAMFLVFAPGTIAGLIPWLIVQWPAPADARWAAVGLIFLIPGAILLLDCFRRFAVQGLGTPAPIAPPERLVVIGAYRHVRNPMYVAVVSLILGQAALFASLPLLIYGVVMWAGFHAFVLGYEEPTLRRQFPEDYVVYFDAVPRWVPRFTPWDGTWLTRWEREDPDSGGG